MKIKEVEESLGISRETVRYYIKEGLVSPQQKENKYREYDESDIELLKKILVLRKLGVSISEIRELLNGRVSLQDVLENNIRSMKRKQKDISTAIEKCYEILSDETLDFDTNRYFDEFNS